MGWGEWDGGGVAGGLSALVRGWDGRNAVGELDVAALRAWDRGTSNSFLLLQGGLFPILL